LRVATFVGTLRCGSFVLHRTLRLLRFAGLRSATFAVVRITGRLRCVAAYAFTCVVPFCLLLPPGLHHAPLSGLLLRCYGDLPVYDLRLRYPLFWIPYRIVLRLRLPHAAARGCYRFGFAATPHVLITGLCRCAFVRVQFFPTVGVAFAAARCALLLDYAPDCHLYAAHCRCLPLYVPAFARLSIRCRCRYACAAFTF